VNDDGRGGAPVLKAALGALVAVGLLGTGWYVMQRRKADERIKSAGAQLTLDEKGPAATEARRGAHLWYRVQLDDVPIGRAEALECDWVDPAGRVAHHNAWTTLPIDHAPWPTHCQWTLPATAAAGGWTVRMRLGPRELSTTAFQVRE
jgi:hypothetical protein